MAKRKKQPKKKGGPYLAAAFFCETVIEDKRDGAFSAIRIIDTITVLLPASAPKEIPSEQHRIPVAISGLLSFKSGDSPGEHMIRLVAESPSGKTQTVMEQVVPFTPVQHGGANIRLNQIIQVKKGGLFWLHVFLDGKRVACMPLHISVEREGFLGQPTASPG